MRIGRLVIMPSRSLMQFAAVCVGIALAENIPGVHLHAQLGRTIFMLTLGIVPKSPKRPKGGTRIKMDPFCFGGTGGSA